MDTSRLMRRDYLDQHDADLAANRDGRLSPGQRRRFAGARIAEHALGALVILFGFAWIVHTLRLAPSLPAIGGVAALVIIALALLLVYRLRQERDSAVKAADGKLTIAEDELLAGSALREIAVGDVAFYVMPSTVRRLDAGTAYRAYYLPRSPQVGGNLLLTVESLEKPE